MRTMRETNLQLERVPQPMNRDRALAAASDVLLGGPLDLVVDLDIFHHGRSSAFALANDGLVLVHRKQRQAQIRELLALGARVLRRTTLQVAVHGLEVRGVVFVLQDGSSRRMRQAHAELNDADHTGGKK